MASGRPGDISGAMFGFLQKVTKFDDWRQKAFIAEACEQVSHAVVLMLSPFLSQQEA